MDGLQESLGRMGVELDVRTRRATPFSPTPPFPPPPMYSTPISLPHPSPFLPSRTFLHVYFRSRYKSSV